MSGESVFRTACHPGGPADPSCTTLLTSPFWSAFPPGRPGRPWRCDAPPRTRRSARSGHRIECYFLGPGDAAPCDDRVGHGTLRRIVGDHATWGPRPRYVWSRRASPRGFNFPLHRITPPCSSCHRPEPPPNGHAARDAPRGSVNAGHPPRRAAPPQRGSDLMEREMETRPARAIAGAALAVKKPRPDIYIVCSNGLKASLEELEKRGWTGGAQS